MLTATRQLGEITMSTTIKDPNNPLCGALSDSTPNLTPETTKQQAKRNVSLKSKLIGYISSLHPTYQFNVYDLAAELGTTRGSLNLYLQDLVASSRIYIVPTGHGSKMYTYQKAKPHALKPVTIPISNQSDLWNTMFYFCAPPPPAETDWSAIFAGINRWSEIVWSIWEARNACKQRETSGTLTSSLTIMATIAR